MEATFAICLSYLSCGDLLIINNASAQKIEKFKKWLAETFVDSLYYSVHVQKTVC